MRPKSEAAAETDPVQLDRAMESYRRGPDVHHRGSSCSLPQWGSAMQSRQANEAADCSTPCHSVLVFWTLRGWIYFERLVSTIRVALTDEQYAAAALDQKFLQSRQPSNSFKHAEARTVYANAPDLKE